MTLGLLAAGAMGPLQAGTYFASDFLEAPDAVIHVHGYDGTGSELTVEICIDPQSDDKSEMMTSVHNVIRSFNQRTPTTNNLEFGAQTNVPSNRLDFESVLLHEIGHCLGLGHTNLASESGLGCATPDFDCTDCNDCERDFTKSLEGQNEEFDLDLGPDGIIGTADDLRGDDINLFWFRESNNNPFTMPSSVDSTTYSRNPADLPAGDDYAATASRCVANELLGACDTEAVMKQGAFTGEAQRTLAHDDVATLRYAMSGLDELAGTDDNYTWTLEFVGETDDCDIVISVEPIQGLAFCQSFIEQFRPPNDNHWRMAKSPPADEPSKAKLNSSVNWFFNDVPNDECSIAQNLHLSGQTISDTQVFEACETITATDFTITGTGDVTFRAGQQVILDEGFHVEEGGRFATEIDPTIQ